ncbi:hypothetical protein B0H11DRAFT_2225332 [Mycena galericulata]|nr:hypothetical protein B0H11DRAFT_2225332 [Mycena galericulata]
MSYLAKHGELLWTEKLGYIATALTLPAAILWRVATTSYAEYNKERSVKRIAGDAALRHTINLLNVPQLQWAFGTTQGIYEKWATSNKLPVTVDELGEDAQLLWIGPKRLERVHGDSGGGFLLPAVDFSLSFSRYVQLELEKQNIEVGFPLLNYTLAPTATFPTPLKQAQLALEFLFAAGVKPQNLQLAGDSAGGNLLVQVLSQVLHPLEIVPEIPRDPHPRPAARHVPDLAVGEPLCRQQVPRGERRSARTLAAWGGQILAGVPGADRPFAEAVRAPEGWFAGADRHVERVLVTAGSAECLRDDIIMFREAFKKHHPNTELLVQTGGLHEDVFLDFKVKERKLASVTPLIVEWLATRFTAESTALDMLPTHCALDGMHVTAPLRTDAAVPSDLHHTRRHEQTTEELGGGNIESEQGAAVPTPVRRNGHAVAAAELALGRMEKTGSTTVGE